MSWVDSDMGSAVAVLPQDEIGVGSLSRAEMSGDSSLFKDRYGFFLSDEFHQSSDLPPAVVQARKDKETERELKWKKMQKSWKSLFNYSRNINGRLKQRIRKGIPDPFRGSVWYKLCNAEEVRNKLPNYFKIDLSVINPVTIDEIERDIDRTFPRHSMFIENNGEGQCALRRMLQAYAALDPECGYCQGMGFIAGLFLTYMIEEEAFHCFYATLQRPSCPLRLFYLPKLVEFQKVLHIFGELGRKHLGKLWTHLCDEGMHPTMYVTEWIMTMFCRGFSFDLVTRVWDIFLQEGKIKIVYRVSLALLKNFEKEFLSYKFEKIMELIRELPRHTDAAKVIDLAWKIPLRTAQIEHEEKLYLEMQKQK